MNLIMKYIVKGTLKVERVEDGGCALIGESFPINTAHSDDENGMFLTIQSWDEDSTHVDFNLIKDKKIKITIEVID
jgi:hypothetical protein